jgi:ubiquinone/menaquinone biosynthesis C-methylase UbiE
MSEGPDPAELPIMSRQAAIHEASFQSVSAEYYWVRKRRVVESLVLRHAADIAQAARSPGVFADLGCGSGMDTVRLRQVLLSASGRPWHTIAVDADPGRLAIARARVEAIGATDVEYVETDFNDRLPVDDQSIDFAYCSEVLEHLPNPDRFLRDVRRALGTGGHFLITTPNEPNVLQRSFWSRRARAQLASEADEPTTVIINRAPKQVFGHISVHPVREWDRKLAAADFKLVAWGRGSLLYGGRPWHDREAFLAVLFAVQAVLDRLPGGLPRRLTDQVISLYRAV